MTKRDLINLLDDLDDDTEIRFMGQPSWPFEYSIQGAVLALDLYGFQPADMGNRDLDEIIYLVEGEQLGYGCNSAWEAYGR